MHLGIVGRSSVVEEVVSVRCIGKVDGSLSIDIGVQSSSAGLQLTAATAEFRLLAERWRGC